MFYRIFFLMKTVREDSENKILIYKKHPACPRGSAGFTENFKRYRHMTSQEANSIPIGDILSRYGYEPSHRYGGYDMYSSPFRRDASPSFKVFRDENRWYDFGEGSHGRTVNLVMRMENCSFAQAMKHIEALGFSSGTTSVQPKQASRAIQSVSSMQIRDVMPVRNRYLLSYAASRGIDADIVSRFCVEVHYSFEKNPGEKFALGFANDHGGYELRNVMFKGCAKVKDITCISAGNGSCAVFEGFFDFLSFEQYVKDHPRMTELRKLDVCVLNSTALTDRSRDFLSGYKTVHAFLDNDKAGNDALDRIRGFLPKGSILVNESERLYPSCNDFNEFLQGVKCPATGNEM